MATAVFYKRFLMRRSLMRLPEVPALPEGFVWIPWNDLWLETHAEVKYRAFLGEIDSRVFPSLASPQGCERLMRYIRAKPGFCPEATWLIASIDGFVGTVQGALETSREGALQNLGVVPSARGLGLGTALLLKALAGFRRRGLTSAQLQVTARNTPVVRLYHRWGFEIQRTLFRGP